MSSPFTVLPATARRSSVAGAHGELAALVVAPPDHVRVAGSVLLVPGYTGSKEDFAPILGPVSAAGYRVLSIDQRGQHESPHAADASGYDIEPLAEDLLAVANNLEGPVHLLGHSFGGLVARAAVIARPPAWRSLVLMASGPAAIPAPRADRIRQLQGLGIDDLAILWAIIEQRDAQAGLPAAAPETRAFLHARWHRNDPVGMRRMGEGILSEPDRVDELASAGVPMLVVFGAADDAWPPTAQQAMAARLGAPVVRIDGAAHSPAMEAPAATVDALLSWWRQHP